MEIVAFAGASNWPLWAGLKHGLFSVEGLDLQLRITPNSRAMAADLHLGRCDIALTAIDNVIAYVEGQGEEPLNGVCDFFAFMGVDDGLLSIVAQPDIADVAALRGKELSVDAMTTGFAFVLREMIGHAGLSDDDVRYVAVGGGAERLAALKRGEQAATLLNTPLDLMALSSGRRRLMRAIDVIGPYQGVVGAARRAWAAENGDRLAAFIRGFRHALHWLTQPAHRAEACALFRERVPSATPALAEQAFAALIASPEGLRRDLSIDLDGVATVLALRRRYGRPQLTLGEPTEYVNDEFRQAALRDAPALT